MQILSPDWIVGAKFLADLGQFLLGLVTVFLALYAAIFRRREIFRSELQKRQFEELAVIRKQLHEIWFEFSYLPFIRSTMKTMNWNLDQLRDNSSDDWNQVKRYHATSLSLFYKFQSSDYFLVPEWMDKQKGREFYHTMEQYVPFTLFSSTSQTDTNREKYLNEILAMILYFDKILRAHG